MDGGGINYEDRTQVSKFFEEMTENQILNFEK